MTNTLKITSINILNSKYRILFTLGIYFISYSFFYSDFLASCMQENSQEELIAEIRGIKTRNIRLQNENINLTEENARLEIENYTLIEENQDLLRDNEYLQIELFDTKNYLEQAENLQNQAEFYYEETLKDYNKAQTHIENLKGQVTELKNDLESTNFALQTSENLLKRKSYDLVAQANENAKIQKIYNKIKEENNELYRENVTYTVRSEAQEAEIARLNRRLVVADPLRDMRILHLEEELKNIRQAEFVSKPTLKRYATR